MSRLLLAAILAIAWGYGASKLLTPFDGVVAAVVGFGLMLLMFGVLDSGHDSRRVGRRSRW